jgi:hypothetical protein
MFCILASVTKSAAQRVRGERPFDAGQRAALLHDVAHGRQRLAEVTAFSDAAEEGA